LKPLESGTDRSPAAVLQSERQFQIWVYQVAHAQLLLRANRTETAPTRIEVLFKMVSWLNLPSVMEGLTIVETPGDSVAEARSLDPAVLAHRRLFLLSGPSFRGYVVAGAVFVREDSEPYFAPSAFSDSFLPSRQP
jgi:hypothetical protein